MFNFHNMFLKQVFRSCGCSADVPSDGQSQPLAKAAGFVRGKSHTMATAGWRQTAMASIPSSCAVVPLSRFAQANVAHVSNLSTATLVHCKLIVSTVVYCSHIQII